MSEIIHLCFISATKKRPFYHHPRIHPSHSRQRTFPGANRNTRTNGNKEWASFPTKKLLNRSKLRQAIIIKLLINWHLLYAVANERATPNEAAARGRQISTARPSSPDSLIPPQSAMPRKSLIIGSREHFWAFSGRDGGARLQTDAAGRR